MTVALSTSRWTFTGDGSTKTPYTFDSKIFADAELLVYVAGVLQTLTTHYTVTGAGDQDGGYVTFVTAPADGAAIVMVRGVVAKQPTEYPEGGNFPSRAHENGLDRNVIVIQQQQEVLERTIKLAVTSALSDIIFPEPSALGVIRWNAGNTALETAVLAELASALDVALVTLTTGDFLYYDGADWVNATAGAVRALLDLEPGTDVEAIDADILRADTTDSLEVGYSADGYDFGTETTGTFTPDPALGNFQYGVNGGAHTLAPPTLNCAILLQYTNDGSAGALTTSGFTIVDGDSLTTTSGDDFFLQILKLNGFSSLTVKALQ